MRYDAVVIGAGPAGSSAALAIAHQGRRVAIVERNTFPRRKVCGEFMSAVNLDLLDCLGAGPVVREKAGPPISRLAVFASGPGIEAPMPSAAGDAFGRALGRDVLDTVLLDTARASGVEVFQPWRAVEILRDGEVSQITISNGADQLQLEAPVVVAAHGSWEPGKLVSNLEKRKDAHDFLGFKAHFTGASLASELMPLIAFPGGYGGLVWADQGRLSLSCCIRRDVLARVRSQFPPLSAALAVHAYILQSCPAVADALAGSGTQGEWLAAGPIRPGIRAAYEEDIFRVGNIAGESHPIIAEGISMALQSGWLLAQELGKERQWHSSGRRAAGNRYSQAWRKQFATRVHLSSGLAQLAISPLATTVLTAIVRAFPATLSIGASWSGKTKPLPV